MADKLQVKSTGKPANEAAKTALNIELAGAKSNPAVKIAPRVSAKAEGLQPGILRRLAEDEREHLEPHLHDLLSDVAVSESFDWTHAEAGAGAGGAASSSSSSAAAGAAATESSSGLFGGALAGLSPLGAAVGGVALVAAAAGGGSNGGSDAPASTTPTTPSTTPTQEPFVVTLNGKSFMNKADLGDLEKQSPLVIETKKAVDQTSLVLLDKNGQKIADLVQVQIAGKAVLNQFVNPLTDAASVDDRYFITGKFADGTIIPRFTFVRDTRAPSLLSLQNNEQFTIALSPASDTGVRGDNITSLKQPVLVGTVLDASVATIKIFDASNPLVPLGVASVENGSYAVKLSLPDASGVYQLKAVGVDIYGNESIPEAGADFRVALDKIAQTVSIVEPGFATAENPATSDNLLSVSQLTVSEAAGTPIVLRVDGINRIGVQLNSQTGDQLPILSVKVKVPKTANTDAFDFMLDSADVTLVPSESDASELIAEVTLGQAFLQALADAGALENFDINRFASGIKLQFEVTATYQNNSTVVSALDVVFDPSLVSLPSNGIVFSNRVLSNGIAYANRDFSSNVPAPKLIELSIASPLGERGFQIENVFVRSQSQLTDDALLSATAVSGSPGVYRFDASRLPAAPAASSEIGDPLLFIVVARDGAGNARAFYQDSNGLVQSLQATSLSELGLRTAADGLLSTVDLGLLYQSGNLSSSSTSSFSAILDTSNKVVLSDVLSLASTGLGLGFNKQAVDAVDTAKALRIKLPSDVVLSSVQAELQGVLTDGVTPVKYVLAVDLDPAKIVNTSGSQIVFLNFTNAGESLGKLLNKDTNGFEVDNKQVKLVISALDRAGNKLNQVISAELDVVAFDAAMRVRINPTDLFSPTNDLLLGYQLVPGARVKDSGFGVQRTSNLVINTTVESSETIKLNSNEVSVVSDKISGFTSNAATASSFKVDFAITDDFANDARTNSVNITSQSVTKVVRDNPDTTRVIETRESQLLLGNVDGLDVLIGNKTDQGTAFRTIGKGDYAIGAEKAEVVTLVNVDEDGNKTGETKVDFGDVFEVGSLDFAGVIGRGGNFDTLNFRVSNVTKMDLRDLTSSVSADTKAAVTGLVHGVEILDFTSASSGDNGRNDILLNAATLKALSKASSLADVNDAGTVATLYLTSSDFTTSGFPASSSLIDRIVFDEQLTTQTTGGGILFPQPGETPMNGWFQVVNPQDGPISKTYSVFSTNKVDTSAVEDGAVQFSNVAFNRWQYNENGVAVVSVWIRDGMAVTGAPAA